MSNETIDWKYREPDVAVEVTRPLARSLRESKASLTYRWLERIEDRIEIADDEIFPSEELLDHVPLLIEAVADFMEDPADEGTAADEVMAKAAELGEMRFEQGFSVYQVLKEFEILGGVILSFLRTRITAIGFSPDPDHVVIVAHRVYRALSKIQQSTAARHIALLESRRRELDQRLRLIHSLAGADGSTDGNGSDGSADGVRLEKVRWLSDIGDGERRQGVPLRGVLQEAVRRVRPIAQEGELEVIVDDDVPQVDVPDAEVEQCLVVYLTNALRHCHEVDGACSVSVSATREGDTDELVISVRNTGRVIERSDDITLLADDPDDGTVQGEPGVGLRFARDLVASLDGRTWAEPAYDPDGALFALALPARRSEDGQEGADGDGRG